jgi:[ribosomal protein S5]-alanine N-acetyltransferase
VPLETARLTLLETSPQQLLALIDQPDRFEELAGFPADDELRGFYFSEDVSPAWLDALRHSTKADPWQHGFFIIDRDRRRVVGTAGFKGPPDTDGVVEIAYGVVPSSQNKGYATEAAQALTDFAFASADVKLVRAHTLPEANASTRVLSKCGFRHIGRVVDPEDGPVWRWERARG